MPFLGVAPCPFFRLRETLLVCSFIKWTSTKVVQIIALGSKNGPVPGSLVLHRPIQGKTKNLLVWKQKARAFDIWYIASPSGPLPRLFKLLPWGQKWLHPGADIFYIDLYRENLQKSSYLKPEGLGLWYLVHSFTYWTSAKTVQITALVPKMALSRNWRVLHRLI